MIDRERGAVLVQLARNAIADRLGEEQAIEESAAWLDEPAATFVTLELDGKLRGCIGSLAADRPLREDVLNNARAAAFEDPRFPPLGSDELANLDIEVSVLTPPEQIAFTSEEDFLGQLRPRVDGIVLEYGAHRATYLPQVWQGLPQPERFIAELKKKAGLKANFWSPEIRFSRYMVKSFKE